MCDDLTSTEVLRISKLILKKRFLKLLYKLTFTRTVPLKYQQLVLKDRSPVTNYCRKYFLFASIYLIDLSYPLSLVVDVFTSSPPYL